jgi:hypothetical protein
MKKIIMFMLCFMIAPFASANLAVSIANNTAIIAAGSEAANSSNKNLADNVKNKDYFTPVMRPETSHPEDVNNLVIVNMATPFLTACSAEQYSKALAWQEDCKNISDVKEEYSKSYCPIMSYLRYCDEITKEEALKLKPLKPHYKHVYLKE